MSDLRIASGSCAAPDRPSPIPSYQLAHADAPSVLQRIVLVEQPLMGHPPPLETLKAIRFNDRVSYFIAAS